MPLCVPGETKKYDVTQARIEYPLHNNAINWGLSLQANSGPGTRGPIVPDKDRYLDRMKAHVRIMEDCDLDCQKFGSGLSVVASINQISLGFLALNMLCSFIGAWRWRARVFSTYCTYVSCCVQFIIMIVSGVFLYTDYAVMCMTSTVKVAGSGPTAEWMMADDYISMTWIWGTQFILIFVFACVGMCQQYKCEGGDSMGMGMMSNNSGKQGAVLAVTSSFDATPGPQSKPNNMFYQ